jgi:mannonate dehydratase
MNRRKALGMLGSAAAGLGTISDPLQAYQNAPLAGLPRLKIMDIKVIMTQVGGNHLTNVKVLTSEPGLYGVGCGTHVERPLIVAESIDKYLKPLAVGRYVDEIEQIWQTAWVAPYWRGSVDANNAMSAIDGALWDIMGKRAGMPVYDLMGGKVREGCRMFANAGGRSLQELEDSVRKSMEAGFQHVRINPVNPGGGGRGGGRGGRGEGPSQGGDGPFGIRTSDGPYISGLVAALDHLRKTVGWDVELCHDVHERPTPSGALLLAKAVEQYRPFFMEDLFAPEDSGWYQRVREQSSTPIAMGELFVNQNEWLPLVANRWIDFMRMHISAAGGLNLARKVAHCCEFFGVRTAWHGPPNVSPIGHMVNLQLDLSAYNFGIGEGGDFSDQLKELFPGTPELRRGVRYASPKPGLGIDIDEKIAAKYVPTSPGSNRGARDSEGAPRRP